MYLYEFCSCLIIHYIVFFSYCCSVIPSIELRIVKIVGVYQLYYL